MTNWIEVMALDAIPTLGSRVVKTPSTTIAVFRGRDNAVYAIQDACPHKKGPLSQGIMHGTSVTCPLHNWRIDLTSGQAQSPDEGCVNRFPVKVENGKVYLQLTPQEIAG